MRELKIYLKPHIRKFVLKHHAGKEPLLIDERSMLGSVLMNCTIDKRKFKFDKAVHRYTTEIRVLPTTEVLKRSPRQYQMVKVNIELERWFREAVLVWVRAQVAAGVPASASCKDLMTYYGLDENDITFDAIHKIWTRSLKGEREKLN